MRGSPSAGPAQFGQYLSALRLSVRSGQRPTAGGTVQGRAETIRSRRDNSRSPPRSPGSPFTRHLKFNLVGAAPGAPGRNPSSAAAAVTTAVTAVLRSCPDGAVRTLTRGVHAWFLTQGP